ncbi:MAG: tRNA 2-thiouridine(34) synthase MnmA [Actinobacteria bacterium]|nr:tRNA 2-thiouridine(34) synthase MnmA [Actinomycetota bacterium]
MKVLCAMSGGVDSSVAAAMLLDEGHEVTGCTMRLWGGASDTGCCSVADVDDARRVAQQLGIDHFVFNFGDDFDASVVGPYVASHAAGETPNPCIECNRSLKFDRLLQRADALGFDAVATGHHAVVAHEGTRWHLRRGADRAKDQSYVLYMLGQAQLARTLLPVGRLTKLEVRRRATALGLRTASKPDSQDVCFITSQGGREQFLAERLSFTPATVVDTAGRELATVTAVELVTVGQRKGLGLAGGGVPRYVVDVDVAAARVVVDVAEGLLTDEVTLSTLCWVGDEHAPDPDVASPVPAEAFPVLAQCSAHGEPVAATFDPMTATVRFDKPSRRIAAGQSVVLYRNDEVIVGGVARRARSEAAQSST